MLITLEGIDGSGKTTSWVHLQEKFPELKFTREPTNSWYGDAVYESLNKDDSDSLAELLLYTADHRDHLTRVIEPTLENDEIIISDRYYDSRCAYQAVTLEGIVPNPMEYIKKIHEPWTRIPDKTIFLDVEPSTAVKRSEQGNKFEQVEYLDNVYRMYKKLIEENPERFIVVDSSKDTELDDVLVEVERIVADLRE